MIDGQKQLSAATQYAKSLKPLLTKEQMEAIRDREAKRFWGEGGIPDTVKAGWARYEEWRKEREKVGYPVPQPVVFLLGHDSVVAGVLAECHTALAAALNLDPSCVRMKLTRVDGKIKPVADVNPPSNWVVPVSKSVGDYDKAAIEYIEAGVEEVRGYFYRTVKERLEACDDVPPEWNQEVEEWVANDKAQDQGAS